MSYPYILKIKVVGSNMMTPQHEWDTPDKQWDMHAQFTQNPYKETLIVKTFAHSQQCSITMLQD